MGMNDMINDRVIDNCIKEIYSISGTELLVTDKAGRIITKTGSMTEPDRDLLDDFIGGYDEISETGGRTYVRVANDGITSLVVVAGSGNDSAVFARLAASELKNIIAASWDRVDKNSFFQTLLLDNMLLVDIYNSAKRLHIDTAQQRCVFVVEPVTPRKNDLIGMIRELFYTEAGDHVTAVDDDRVVVIKALAGDDGQDSLEETARMLVDMAGSEAMSDVRVSYGTIAEDIEGVSKSFREAKMALDVGKIFYPMMRTISYGTLGVGRLIYQLPVDLCRTFIKEIFGDNTPEEIDGEILATVDKFFENNLNVSETSRQLYIHRNTLLYRIEKLQKATGLDIRVFDDALTLKIALMVVNYMEYLDETS